MTRRRWTYCERCRDYHDARDPGDTCTQPVTVPPLAVAVVLVLSLVLARLLWHYLGGDQ